MKQGFYIFNEGGGKKPEIVFAWPGDREEPRKRIPGVEKAMRLIEEVYPVGFKGVERWHCLDKLKKRYEELSNSDEDFYRMFLFSWNADAIISKDFSETKLAGIMERL